jgi:uncharacterized protein YbaP (TraB family)
MVSKNLIIIIFLLIPSFGFAQSDKVKSVKFYQLTDSSTIIPTYLWKVSGKDIKTTVYLIGTCHVVGLSWIERQPVVSGIIKSSTFLTTESFSSMENQKTLENALPTMKGVDLLNKEQYLLLDSFFRATAGETEGLQNEDAKNATVVELASGILEMLLRKGPNGTYEQMDLQLFKLFEKQKKKTMALEDTQTLNFKFKDTIGAKNLLSKYVSLVKGNNEFDLNNPKSAVNEIVEWYKKGEFDYELDKSQPEGMIIDRSALTVAERNKSWIPKLEENMKDNSSIIAVGILHLFYKTGIISLLRKEGYIVEPVFFK